MIKCMGLRKAAGVPDSELNSPTQVEQAPRGKQTGRPLGRIWERDRYSNEPPETRDAKLSLPREMFGVTYWWRSTEKHRK